MFTLVASAFPTRFVSFVSLVSLVSLVSIVSLCHLVHKKGRCSGVPPQLSHYRESNGRTTRARAHRGSLIPPPVLFALDSLFPLQGPM